MKGEREDECSVTFWRIRRNCMIQLGEYDSRSLSFPNNSFFSPVLFLTSSSSSSHFCHSQPPSFVSPPARLSSAFTRALNQSYVQLRVKQDVHSAGLWAAGVCERGRLHGCTSQADFVLNLSPKCTQKTIVRLIGVKSITGSGRERQTFRLSAGFYKAKFKEPFNATWKGIGAI